jgi:hypothetical protein
MPTIFREIQLGLTFEYDSSQYRTQGLVRARDRDIYYLSHRAAHLEPGKYLCGSHQRIYLARVQVLGLGYWEI